MFDTKTDVLDGLDEVISQWIDAIRMGRIKRYIPENLISRDPVPGGCYNSQIRLIMTLLPIGDNMGKNPVIR